MARLSIEDLPEKAFLEMFTQGSDEESLMGTDWWNKSVCWLQWCCSQHCKYHYNLFCGFVRISHWWAYQS